MSFFNSKEEVIDIQLTKYGKKILANGVFMPTYYTFFDDDIVYDASTYGLSEKQNDIQKRILEETPYLKTITNFTSCSLDIVKLEEEIDSSKFFGISLNSSDDSIKYVPSFDISFKNSSIERVDLSSTSSYNKFNCEIIPQIYLKDQIVSIVVDKNFAGSDKNLSDMYPLSVADDDTYVKIKISDMIFHIIENNVGELEDNFEIEVHKIDNDIDQILFLSSDVLKTNNSYIKNDLLIGAPYVPDYFSNTILPEDALLENNAFNESDRKKAKYYFDIQLDNFVDDKNEISNNKLYIYDDMTNIAPKGDNC